MKLSFSTRGWPNLSFEEMLEVASDMGFSGVEVYNLTKLDPLTEKGGSFHKYNIAATVRKMRDKGISIPCFDTSLDVSKDEDAVATATALIEIAHDAKVPYVVVCALSDDEDAVFKGLSQLLPIAEENGVSILVKTSGIYSDTARLRAMLDRFASDNLAALWNLHDPHYFGGETPDKTIRNLGAYVRHVRICDSEKSELGPVYCLMGEGDLPVEKILVALRSIDYKGHISLCRAPENAGITDTDIILPQFTNAMEIHSDKQRSRKALYENKTGTGKFIWQKDVLLDMTFSQVLDTLVETFPNQYAFRFTTLNYTRTYEEFREDVDTFARALVALGV